MLKSSLVWTASNDEELRWSTEAKISLLERGGPVVFRPYCPLGVQQHSCQLRND